MSFTSLVEEYSKHLPNVIQLKAKYESVVGADNFAAMLLLDKLEKHDGNGNIRSMASYLSMWIKEGFGKLPERAKELARKNKLKYQGDMVGYPHQDGTYHWFSTK